MRVGRGEFGRAVYAWSTAFLISLAATSLVGRPSGVPLVVALLSFVVALTVLTHRAVRRGATIDLAGSTFAAFVVVVVAQSLNGVWATHRLHDYGIPVDRVWGVTLVLLPVVGGTVFAAGAYVGTRVGLRTL